VKNVFKPRNSSWITKGRASSWRTWQNKKSLITTEVTTTFLISPCTPISYTSFLRPTTVSWLKDVSQSEPVGKEPQCIVPLAKQLKELIKGDSCNGMKTGWTIEGSLLIQLRFLGSRLKGKEISHDKSFAAK